MHLSADEVVVQRKRESLLGLSFVASTRYLLPFWDPQPYA